jgi:hypothetical protein
MKRPIFIGIVLCAVLGLAMTASAQEKIIKFKDGGVVRGVIVSKSGDFYEIKTASLGFLRVQESNIAVIEDPALEKTSVPQQVFQPASSSMTPTASGSSLQGSADWKAYEQKITSNPESMAAIQALTQDKDVRDLMADPKLLAAIMSGNIEYLKNNEKFLKFANNPTVKKIADATVAPEQGAVHAGQNKN